jgi:poly(A) polymerase
MNSKIAPTDWLHCPETAYLVEVFAAAGIPLRFVGGAVRDTLLKKPVMDVDAATPTPPQKVMSLLGNAGMKTIPTGLSHGTITAVINHRHYEITTLRRDIKNFGRHAEVLFTDNWEEDAARRDFTMNALYADPDGTVYDYFGGIEDALAGRVRFIGDAARRIQEDALRILRFFRFHALYGETDLDEAGLAACVQEKHRLSQLSGERISAEMIKLLAAENAPEVLNQMQQAGILTEVIPGVLDASSLLALRRVRLMADREAIDPLVPLALLLRGQNQQATPLKPLIMRWRLSNKQAALLEFLVTNENIPADVSDATQKRLLRKMGAEAFGALVLVSWCEMLTSQPSQAQILSAAYRVMLGLSARWTPPEFPVNGDDLRRLGMLSGPLMGQWLKKLERIWEEEGYKPTKEQLLAQVQTA